jgi:hypothetical protein
MFGMPFPKDGGSRWDAAHDLARAMRSGDVGCDAYITYSMIFGERSERLRTASLRCMDAKVAGSRVRASECSSARASTWRLTRFWAGPPSTLRIV